MDAVPAVPKRLRSPISCFTAARGFKKRLEQGECGQMKFENSSSKFGIFSFSHALMFFTMRS